jgi:hypothetical protein
MPNPNDKRPTRDPMTDEPGQRPSRSPDPNEEESQYGGGERQAPGYNEPDRDEGGDEDENARRRRDRVDDE